jgi:hypothetical protein
VFFPSTIVAYAAAAAYFDEQAAAEAAADERVFIPSTIVAYGSAGAASTTIHIFVALRLGCNRAQQESRCEGSRHHD